MLGTAGCGTGPGLASTTSGVIEINVTSVRIKQVKDALSIYIKPWCIAIAK